MLTGEKKLIGKADKTLRLFYLCLAAVFFYLVYQVKVTGAYDDMWDMLFYVQYLDRGELTPHHFFEKHFGAHVLAIPKVLFLIDYKLFHGQGYLLLAISLCCFCISYLLIKNQIDKINDVVKKRWLLFATTIIFFSAWQIPNLVYPFQVQWYLSLMFSLIAFEFIGRDKKTAKNIWTAFVMAILSGLCGFFGVPALMIVILATIFCDTKPYIKIFLLIFMLIAAWFFYPDQSVYKIGDGKAVLINQQLLINLSQQEPRSFFPYFFTNLFKWFGNPLSMLDPLLGMFFGFMVCVYLGGIVLIGFLKKIKVDFWFLLTVYAISLIFSICAGRYWSGDGAEDRYVTVYSLVLVCAFYWVFNPVRDRTMIALVSSLSIALCFVSITKFTDEQDQSVVREKADVSILNGVYQNAAYGKVWFLADALGFQPVTYFHDYLKSNKIDIFYGRIEHLDDIKISSNRCEGVIRKGFYLPQNNIRDYYLGLWDHTRNIPISSWYLTENGVVKFYGATYSVKWRLLPITLQKQDNLESYTSIPGKFTLKDFSLVGVNTNGEYCRIDLRAKKNKLQSH